MLVMSLSPLLGQAIPDIAETAEILVFPRRGARSGSSRVPEPREEKYTPFHDKKKYVKKTCPLNLNFLSDSGF